MYEMSLVNHDMRLFMSGISKLVHPAFPRSLKLPVTPSATPSSI